VAPKQWVKLTKEGPSPAAVINQKTHPLHKRLLVIPRKKLPDIDQHERLLGASLYLHFIAIVEIYFLYQISAEDLRG
jgi:hypothetical protein